MDSNNITTSQASTRQNKTAVTDDSDAKDSNAKEGSVDTKVEDKNETVRENLFPLGSTDASYSTLCTYDCD